MNPKQAELLRMLENPEALKLQGPLVAHLAEVCLNALDDRRWQKMEDYYRRNFRIGSVQTGALPVLNGSNLRRQPDQSRGSFRRQIFNTQADLRDATWGLGRRKTIDAFAAADEEAGAANNWPVNRGENNSNEPTQFIRVRTVMHADSFFTINQFSQDGENPSSFITIKAHNMQKGLTAGYDIELDEAEPLLRLVGTSAHDINGIFGPKNLEEQAEVLARAFSNERLLSGTPEKTHQSQILAVRNIVDLIKEDEQLKTVIQPQDDCDVLSLRDTHNAENLLRLALTSKGLTLIITGRHPSRARINETFYMNFNYGEARAECGALGGYHIYTGYDAAEAIIERLNDMIGKIRDGQYITGPAQGPMYSLVKKTNDENEGLTYEL